MEMGTVAGIEQILALIGRKTRVIHGSSEASGYGGGGDIDCVVEGLDGLWPLRLQSPARLVNRLRYDVTATSWFVESNGEGVSIDTLEDPDGIGKYGFSTGSVTGESLVDPGSAAAYLAIKRLRKRNLEAAAWVQVAKLATHDADGFRKKLSASLPRTAEAVEAVVLASTAPDRALAARALRDLRITRLHHPFRIARYTWLGAGRIAERLTYSTGLYVVLVGPDGTGKSTIAHALAADCFGFRRSRRLHWRPGILPGSRTGGPGGRDTTRPHDTKGRSRGRSVPIVLYHWADFLIGSLATIWPATRRSTLIVAERPWWDLGVDPLRYRLDVSPELVSKLGRILRKPDLVLNLAAPAATLVARKPEITLEATDRQLASWQTLAPALTRTESIDVTGTPEQSIAKVRSAIHAVAADQAFRNLGPGWVAVPNRRRPRWWVPRGPRLVARATFDSWTPMTRSGSSRWRAAGTLAGFGGLRALPRSTPPRDVIERVAPHLERGENVAIHRTNHRGRFIVLFVSPQGAVRRFAKVVTDGDAEPLDREAAALQNLALTLPAPLRAPELLERGEGVLVLEAVSRRRDWDLRIESDVAQALGTFAGGGGTHGDFAPWNLIPADGWVLVDWEEANTDGTQFEDMFHYLVQSCVLLGSPSEPEIIDGVLHERGWIGTALRAFSDASGHDLNEVGSAMTRYLEDSSLRLDRKAPGARAGLEVRARLARALEGR